MTAPPAQGQPLIGVIAAGTPLVRIVSLARGPASALFFGPAAGRAPMHRFDDPEGRFRVCYLADSHRGAVAESLLRLASAPTPPDGIRILDRTALRTRAWARTITTRGLRLADLRNGDGLARRHHTGELTMSASHVAGRIESAALHAMDERLDGIWYRTRHDPGQCAVALFDRAAGALEVVSGVEALLDDPVLIGAMMDRYGVGVES